MQNQLSPFFAMQILDEARKIEMSGADVAHLELGQPTAPFPSELVDKGMRDFAEGNQGYLEAFGLRDLRRNIGEYYRRRHSMEVGIDNIAMTVGASGALILALLAKLKPGHKIALTRPGYPAYRNIAISLGIECVDWVLDPTDGWAVTAKSLARLYEQTYFDAVIIASPSNPTGHVINSEEWEKIARFAESRDVVLISDEIYHGLEFAEAAPSAINFAPKAMIINSFSKYYRMPGWRLGWLLMDDQSIEQIQMLAQNLFLCAPVPAQHIARHALRNASMFEDVKQGYGQARDVLAQKLSQLGFELAGTPDGAFYLYVGLGDLTNRFGTARQFCEAALKSAHVALTPGVDFDPVDGDDFVRFSFAGGLETTQKALNRLKHFLTF